jgi:hypothetical protein
MELPDTIRVTLEVARVLEELRIHYLVGGSVASSIYGHPRSTLDSDLVADLQPRHVQPLTAALSERFYVEPERVVDAIRRRASFNLIHRPTNLKIDIFILKDTPMARQELLRSRRINLLPGEDDMEVPVASPEDMVLQKLQWYQMGNRVSDRQWNDILGVLKVQGKRLDFGYLKEWAPRIGVEDLLRQACEDAGIDPARV